MSDDVNPLLSPPTRSFGVPSYDRIDAAHYLPAFAEAFAAHRRELDAIVSNPAPPDFENTLVALERSGELLDRVSRAFFTVSSADATDEIQAIDAELAPLLAAHRDSVVLDAELFRRIEAVAAELEAVPSPELDDEDRFLVSRWRIEMTLAGAALSAADRERLRAINESLARLSTRFEQQLLHDTNDLAVVITDEAELAGLGDAERSAAARAAAERGLSGAWLIALPLFTGHPWLARLSDPATRARVMRASRARGSRSNTNDNREVVREIVRLRAERAALLGYSSYAGWVTADQTAGTPDAVTALLRSLAAPAAHNAQREKAALALVFAGSSDGEVTAADWAFGAERVRQERYDLDSAALRPWFEAERVLRDGVFFAAHRLYGITFTERFDLPSYHPQVRTFEVREPDGTPLGLYLLDLYTRDTKRGGAWMNSLVAQSGLRGTAPVVVNNLNVAQPASGTPTLLTLDEVTTLFHEFGHALHGLFARVRYPHFAGTAVRRDFVEFPSQVNEMWMLWPEVLRNYARHVETGEPLPEEVVARLRAAETFNQGFATSEYLAAAWLDFAWHSLSPSEAAAVDDVAAFERASLADIGLDDPAIPPRYSTPYFAHIFSTGYAAGYYSYIWSEVLDADTVEWFREQGGLVREAGERFRRRLLGVGGSRDPLLAYRDFRGRDARIEPLLARRGLAAPDDDA